MRYIILILLTLSCAAQQGFVRGLTARSSYCHLLSENHAVCEAIVRVARYDGKTIDIKLSCGQGNATCRKIEEQTTYQFEFLVETRDNYQNAARPPAVTACLVSA